MSKKIICVAILLILASLLLPLQADDSLLQPNILIVHSYNIDYPWTLSQHEAFIDSLKTKGFKPQISVEFMDAKKYPKGVDYEAFRNLLDVKYQSRSFDLIYTTDNDAFNLLLQSGDSLFPKVPVISSGINMGTELKELPSTMNVVMETSEFFRTISMMQIANPSMKTLHIVNDRSTTGSLFKRQLQSDIRLARLPLNVVWLEDLNLQQLAEKASKLGPTDGLMITIYFTDGINATYQYDEAAEAITAASAVPLWCNWDFYEGTGALGGRVVSGSLQGVEAAKLAHRLLIGDSAGTIISDTKALNKTAIDYTVMKRFNLEEKSFPDETEYLNKPPSRFLISKTAMIALAITFGSLILVIIILSTIIHYQRVIRKQDQDFLALKTSTISDQKEVLFRLGELIETRSHDTGNHVKRVALLCRFIGTELGMEEEALDELEIAAPMHDIGKIGIPEEILSKPALLTDEERRIMNTHTSIGNMLFRNSDLSIFKTAATIAHQHHEYWNGQGYPQNLYGEEIHIYSRITAIVDVMDALLSYRVYKKPWPLEDVLAFITDQKGVMFDPALVEIVLNRIEDILEIRNAHLDTPLADKMCPF